MLVLFKPFSSSFHSLIEFIAQSHSSISILYLPSLMSTHPEQAKREKNSIKDYFSFGEVFLYFFRKKDPNNRPNFNLRMMHGVNKISIIMFLVGVVVLLVKLFILRR